MKILKLTFNPGFAIALVQKGNHLQKEFFMPRHKMKKHKTPGKPLPFAP